MLGDWSKTCAGVLVRGPEDFGPELAGAFGGLRQEVIVVLPLDPGRHVIDCSLVAAGSPNVARVSPRDIFGRVLAAGGTCVIVAHNHPSGRTGPSEVDLELTRRLIEAGQVLELALLDHVIVAGRSWRSLRESTSLWDGGE